MSMIPVFERPRPWRRPRPGVCVRCDQPAEFLIESCDPRPYAVRATLFHLKTSEIVYTLSCAAHREAVMDDYVERFGFTSSQPTSPVSWRYWLASLYWRPVNRVLNRIRHGPRLSSS